MLRLYTHNPRPLPIQVHGDTDMQEAGLAKYDELDSVTTDTQEQGELLWAWDVGPAKVDAPTDVPFQTNMSVPTTLERRLVLSKDVKPSEVILRIPPTSLINVRTIDGYLAAELLPSPERPSHPSNWKSTATSANEEEAKLPLTSVQSLTFLLASWRSIRRAKGESEEKHQTENDGRMKILDQVLSSFPTSYSSFPLAWKVLSSTIDENLAAASSQVLLLESLPGHLSTLCDKVHERFVKDCSAVQSVHQHAPQLFTFLGEQVDNIRVDDLLWAWCSVNSRCVYVPLGLTPHLDNFTLAVGTPLVVHKGDV